MYIYRVLYQRSYITAPLREHLKFQEKLNSTDLLEVKRGEK